MTRFRAFVTSSTVSSGSTRQFTFAAANCGTAFLAQPATATAAVSLTALHPARPRVAADRRAPAGCVQRAVRVNALALVVQQALGSVVRATGLLVRREWDDDVAIGPAPFAFVS